MSDTAYSPRPRATRARTLGDAVPVFRGFRDDDEPKIVPKSADELRADREAARDAAPMTTRCAVDGCGWSHTGSAGDCRLAAAAHRVADHPELTGVRTHRSGMRLKRRGEHVDPAVVAESRRLRQERDDAARLEQIERGRRSRGELLEEVASAPGGAHSDAASSSSPIQEATMENRYGLARTGRGFVWTKEAALQAVRDFHAANERAPRKQDAIDEPIGALPSGKSATLLFGGWDEMLRAAGLTPAEATYRPGKRNPKSDANLRRTAAAAPALEPEPAPEPEPQPQPQRALVVAENALRDPVRTADIPYDADVLEDEADFLERRAAALRMLAEGIRTLAELNTERAA